MNTRTDPSGVPKEPNALESDSSKPLILASVWGIFVVVACLAAWAGWAKFDEITRGQGRVIPAKGVQVIQSLEGGILKDMKVFEGKKVSEGDIVALIDDTAHRSSMEEVRIQMDNLVARIQRLEAEARGMSEPVFSQELQKNRPELVNDERDLFQRRKVHLSGSLQALNQSLGFAREELAITEPLARDGVVSQIELLKLQRTVNDLEAQVNNRRNEFLEKVAQELSQGRGEFQVLSENLNILQDRVRRAVLASPVDGIIHKVHFSTLGGVIKPGEPILEIVPTTDELLVEANIRPSDIAFVRPGLAATVKITAYDFSIYGGLSGEVEHISADTFTDERGETFYRIRVRTGDRTLQSSGETLTVIPGMTAQVDILTGEKSLLHYLFKPLLRARDNALTER